GYPPQQGGPPPQQGGYNPQGGNYPPPQQDGYHPPQQGGYPPQQGGPPPGGKNDSGCVFILLIICLPMFAIYKKDNNQCSKHVWINVALCFILCAWF
ncbi:hypothetical protein PENTCL1PPCAC_10822, partial [Pristionchus entomophagus]